MVILKLKDLRQALRKSAGDFCDLAELNEGTTDPNEVEKVRHMIEAALDSIDDTPIFVDVISTKSFLASKLGISPRISRHLGLAAAIRTAPKMAQKVSHGKPYSDQCSTVRRLYRRNRWKIRIGVWDLNGGIKSRLGTQKKVSA
jgi:hypothetical protein